MIEPSIKQEDLFVALRSFLVSLFECPVIQNDVNDVPIPQGSFIAMGELSTERLSHNSHKYSATSIEIKSPMSFTFQVDFYGEDAFDMCSTFVSLANDGYCFDAFPESIKPLYATAPKKIDFVTGEKNMFPRFMTEFTLQFNPTVTTAIDTFDEISVTIIHANGLS